MIWRRWRRAPVAALAPDDALAAARADVWREETLRLLALTREGIALREAGELDRAEAVFTRLTQESPDRPYGWQELGVLRAQRGEPDAAIALFTRAMAVEPDDVLPRKHAALLHLELGRPEEGEALLQAHPQRTPAQRAEVAAVLQFLRYWRRWPEAVPLALAQALERGPGFVRADELEARALAALRERRGFSLVRLGDGEGAWIRLSTEDETDYPDLYAANRREFLRLWFADDSLHDRPDFLRAAAGLDAAMAGADVLGVPYSLRVVHEYRLRTPRGVPSITNIMRWIDADPARRVRPVASQDVHLELQFSGGYRRLLTSGAPVGTISCHPGLPAMLAERTGAVVDRALLVPEEKGFSDVLGGAGACGAHFPHAFDRIIAQLREGGGEQGRLWLVAAGFLGKLYCQAIRQAGGVALDVGSVADGWLGKVTRPTLVELDRFAL